MANFIKGMFTEKKQNSPDFVICNQNIKVEEFTTWLQENKNEAGYVNIQVKKSKEGKIYTELNDFKPKKENTVVENTQTDDNTELPF